MKINLFSFLVKLKRLSGATLLCGLAFSLSACNWLVLNPKGQIAVSEKQILLLSLALMLLVVVPVIVLTLSFAWRYRAQNTRATYAPEWAHSTLLELIWWSVPCLIIAILGTLTWFTSQQLDPYKPLGFKNQPLTIQAIALEWKWLFIYPEQNIATVNFVQFPVGVPVRFDITAEGPMNSFQIPQLAGQIYAMAGMQTKLHLIADAVGDYRGVSANYSGAGFSDMKFTARASSAEEFARWVKTVRQASARLTELTYSDLLKPSKNNTIQYFSSTHPDLFNRVVMKSMMPMKIMADPGTKKIALTLEK